MLEFHSPLEYQQSLRSPTASLLGSQQGNGDHDNNNLNCRGTIQVTLIMILMITNHNNYHHYKLPRNFHTSAKMRPMKIVWERLMVSKRLKANTLKSYVDDHLILNHQNLTITSKSCKILPSTLPRYWVINLNIMGISVKDHKKSART